LPFRVMYLEPMELLNLYACDTEGLRLPLDGTLREWFM